MIKKLKAFLVANLILSAVLAMILAVVVCLGWKATLTSVVATIPAINRMAEPYSNKTDYAKNTYEDNRFEYTPLGVIYHAPTGIDAGPFQYLFTDEFYFSWETVARYIGVNGKYGYVNKDGALLTEPIFIDAAEFEDGTARVQEETGRIYYINEEGKRITRDYLDGSSTFEMQGLYCRVQEDDGTWGIINRKDEMILSGADSIEELPLVTCLGSAIINGKAVLFELLPFDESEDEIRIIASYDSFVKISYVYSGEFAFVWTQDGQMGVVDYEGDVIVPAVYQKIEYKYFGEELIVENLVFLAHDDCGTVQVIHARKGDMV